MANKLYNPDGTEIPYTKDSYDMETQENIETPEYKAPDYMGKGNFLDSMAATEGEFSGRSTTSSEFAVPENMGDNRYDGSVIGAQSFEELQNNRIEQQSHFTKGALAITNGLTGAIGTALKDIGYFTSPQNYTNYNEMHSVDSMNVVSGSMQKLGNWLEKGSEEWMPIYEKPSDPNSVLDQVLKWGSLKGAIQSTIGFLVPGMAAVKALKAGTKTLKAAGKLSKYIGTISDSAKFTKAGDKLLRADRAAETVAAAFPRASQAYNSLGASYIQSTGEATWEAIDAHDQILYDLAPLINSGRISGEDASAIANEAGEFTFQGNMIKGALNISALSKFTPGKLAKNTIKKPGVWEGIKRNAAEVPQEALEEGSQNVLKQEAEHRAFQDYAKLVGDSPIIQDLISLGKFDNGVSDNTATRLKEFATSNEVIVDAIIGGLSGGISQPAVSYALNSKGRVLHQLKKDKLAYQEYLDKEASTVSDMSDASVKEKMGKVASGQTIPGQGGYVPKAEDTPAAEQTTEESLQSMSLKGIKEAVRKRKEKKKAKEAVNKKVATKLNSEKDIQNNVERTALAARLEEITRDDPEKAAIVKEQVYIAMINDSIANGTFEAFLKEADRTKGTNAFTADLHDYAVGVESMYVQAQKYQNTAEIVGALSIGASYNKLEQSLKSKEARLVNDTRENAGTEAIQENLAAVRSELATLEKNKEENTRHLNQLKSVGTQVRLFQNKNAREEMLKVRENLGKVTSMKELEHQARVHPTIINTKEYVRARKRISPSKTSTSKAKSEAAHPVDDNIQEEPDNITATEQGVEINNEAETPSNPNVSLWQESAIEDKFNTAFVDAPLNEEEMSGVVFKALEASRALSNSATQKDYDHVMTKMVDSLTKSVVTTREKQSPAGVQEAQGVNSAVREYANVASGPLPEAEVDRVVNSISKAVAINKEQSDINEDESITQEQKDARILETNRKLVEEIVPELDAAKKAFDLAAEKEAMNNKSGSKTGKPAEATNTKGLDWKEIRSDFNKFAEYISDIKGEDFLRDNYRTVKNMFTGDTTYNKNKPVPDTYSDYKENADYGSNNDVEFSTTEQAKASKLEELNKAVDDAKEPGLRTTYNRDPAASIAHLSESYSIGEDPYGNPILFNDSNPAYNISPLLNPNEYNGGESMEFSLDFDYNGSIALPGLNGDKVMVNWADLMRKSFTSTPVKGSPLQFNRNAVADINKAWKTNIHSVYDALPIAIYGKEGTEKVGYMHNPSWINENTTDPDLIDAFKTKLSNSRAAVMKSVKDGTPAKGKIVAKILKNAEGTNYYKGFSMTYGKTFQNAAERIPDNFPMGIVMDSKITINDKKVNISDILNYENVVSDGNTGLPVVFVPVGKTNGVMKYHAEVIYSTRLSDPLKTVAKSIVESFLTGNKNTPAYQFYKDYGYDITTAIGANKVLSSFIQVFDAKNTNFDFETYLEDTPGVTAKIALTEDDNGNKEVKFGIGASKTLSSSKANQINNYAVYGRDLESMFDTDKFAFRANSLFLNNPSNKRNPPTPQVSEAGVITAKGGNYSDFVKDNAETLLKNVPESPGSENRVYTLQNIVTFEVEGGAVPRESYEQEGITETTEKPPLVDEPIGEDVETEDGATTYEKEGIPSGQVGSNKVTTAIADMGLNNYVAKGVSPETMAITLGLSQEDGVRVYNIVGKSDSQLLETDVSELKSILGTSGIFKQKQPISSLSIFDKLSTKGKKDVSDLFKTNKDITLDTLSTIAEQVGGDVAGFENLVEAFLASSDVTSEQLNMKRNCK